jgi:stage II sporulation protein D
MLYHVLQFTKRQRCLVAIMCGVLTNCIPYIQQREWRNFVRVAIVCGADSVRITGIKNKTFCKDYRIASHDTFPVYIRARNGFVSINDIQYRGDVEIHNRGGRIWVVNICAVEEYLKGVVPCEIGRISSNLIEVAKAQAVAARTYVYAHLDQHEELNFDLYADTRDQVYAGVAVEHQVTSRAIEETKREILTFKGQAIDAKYSSTCGGVTAQFSDVWTGTTPPYLTSIICPYCKKSPYYTWSFKKSKKEFFMNLRQRLEYVGIILAQNELIQDFHFMRNSQSRRVNRVTITTTKGAYDITNYQIRRVFGDETDLKSSYFFLRPEGDSILITGRGYGHGVGMCQFGAIEMARMGKTYQDILRFYYPETEIVRVNY